MSKDKGKISEKKTELYFQKLNCRIETARKRSYWSKQSNDFFNCWDHIVLVDNDIILQAKYKVGSRYIDQPVSFQTGTTLFVQTKTNQASKLKKYQDFYWHNKLMFVWVDGQKEPDIYLLRNNYDHVVCLEDSSSVNKDTKRVSKNVSRRQRDNEVYLF